MSQAKNNEENNNKKYRVHNKGYEAVILYPALVTPAIVEKETGCLSVILATKQDFYDDIHSKNLGEKNAIGEITARKLHAQLAFVKWGDGAVPGPGEVQYTGHMRQVSAAKNMLYASHVEAEKRYKKTKDYQGWYLKELRGEKTIEPEDGEPFTVIEAVDQLIEGYDSTGKPGRKWGVIHGAAAKMYLDSGFKYLFQLNFKNFDQIKTTGMHELCFLQYKLLEDKAKQETASTAEKSQQPASNAEKGQDSKETEESAANEQGNGIPCQFTNPSDDVVTSFFKNDALKMKPQLIRTPVPIKADKTVGGKEMFNLYGADFTTIQSAPWLQSRHPVYIPEKWEGKIGVLGDLHISSRQDLYKKANPRVIPVKLGPDSPASGDSTLDELGLGDNSPQECTNHDRFAHISPNIGQIAHVNKKTAFSLMDTMTSECDLLAVVGDLYDHTRNCDPHVATGITNTGKLWQAMSYPDKKGDYDLYPRTIDGLMMLTKIINLYQKEKPILLVMGNHEPYEHPYGISPRIVGGEDSSSYGKANAGIPADHNLTIYEATLLYGKKYASFVTAANFTRSNFNWLYCHFTPWKDFVLLYEAKTDPYSFTALGWGNKESIKGPVARTSGSLPRATEACTKDQVALAQWATGESKAKHNILCSHFTYICYDSSIPLGESGFIYTDTQVGTNNQTDYEVGTFYENRNAMFAMLMNNTMHYSLSGHSHRAGAYAFNGADSWSLFGNGGMKTAGKVYTDKNIPTVLKPVGNHKILVCGSAGPYSGQNHAGELKGLGMERPQGFILNVPEDSVTWEHAQVPLPRLAVVMEYLWYTKNIPSFYDSGYSIDKGSDTATLREFAGIKQMDDKGELFAFGVNYEIKAIFKGSHPFRAVTLVAVSMEEEDGKSRHASLTLTPTGGTQTFLLAEATDSSDAVKTDIFHLKASSKEVKKYQDDLGDFTPAMYFLSVQFTEVPGVVDKENYDLGPWCFPVEPGEGGKRYSRPKADVGGEVAKHSQYQDLWPKEYGG